MVRKGTRGSAGDRKPRIGAGAAVGRWPPQKSAGILARGLSFAELGTRGTRWRLRRWRMFGPRLGPPKGSRRRGGGVPLQAGRGRGPRGDSRRRRRTACLLSRGGAWSRLGRAEVPLPVPRRCSFPSDLEESWGPAAGGAADATSTTRPSSTAPPFPLPSSPPSCCRKCLPLPQSQNWKRPWRSFLPLPHPVFSFLFPLSLFTPRSVCTPTSKSGKVITDENKGHFIRGQGYQLWAATEGSFT